MEKGEEQEKEEGEEEGGGGGGRGGGGEQEGTKGQICINSPLSHPRPPILSQ